MVTNYFVARQTGGANTKSGVQLHPCSYLEEPLESSKDSSRHTILPVLLAGASTSRFLHGDELRRRNTKLLDRVKSLKLGFYDHTTQKYESLEKEMVQGCVPGYRNRGHNAGIGQMTSPNGLG